MLAAVLAFNTGPYLRLVVEALQKHNLRIIVIDNASEPPVSIDADVVRLEKGCGIIHGRNLGFSLRKDGEGVLAVADDVIVPEGPWEEILLKTQDTTLALRPDGDIAFTEYNRFDDPVSYPDYILGAPTSFQCVHFPGPVLDRIGYVDERYIWGDDGLMMRKNTHGVVRNYKIINYQSINRGPKYRPLRDFYEELWRPGKIDGKYWDTMTVRYTIKDTDNMIQDKCPTLWTMRREHNPSYYDTSQLIKSCFETIWDFPETNRAELLRTIHEKESQIS